MKIKRETLDNGAIIEHGHTFEEYEELYGLDHDNGDLWDFSKKDFEEGAIEPQKNMVYWLMRDKDGEERYFETELEESCESKKEEKEVLDEEELNEGTSNFGRGPDNFPLLVFYTYDDFVDLCRDDIDYPQEEDFEDENGEFDEYAYFNATQEFEQKYWDEAEVCVLDEDQIERLEDKLDDFNIESKKMAEDKDINDDGYQEYGPNLNLDSVKLAIKPGYYEAAYINVEHEDYLEDLDDDFKAQQIERFNKFFKEIKDEFHLTQLNAGPMASDGTRGYSIVKEDGKEEALEEKKKKKDKGIVATGYDLAKATQSMNHMLGSDTMTCEDYDDLDKYDLDSYIKDDEVCVYLFPEGTTKDDVDVATSKFKLKYLGKVEDNQEDRTYIDTALMGKYKDLKRFGDEHLGGYQMHPDFIWKKEEWEEMGPIPFEEDLNEGYVGQTVEDFLGIVILPENIETLIISNIDADDYEETFNGKYEDMPSELNDYEYADFDVGGEKLVVDVSSDDDAYGDDYYSTLGDLLEDYNGDEVCVYNTETDEYIFDGDKSEIEEDILEMRFVSIETPKYLCVNAHCGDSELGIGDIDDIIDSARDEFDGFESLKESMKSEVTKWWNDVEDANIAMQWGFKINNEGCNEEEMHAAMFDMLDELKEKGAFELFKQGKKIYNKYAKYSKYNDGGLLTPYDKEESLDESRGKGFVCKYKGYNIIDAGDRYVITNKNGLNVGESKFGLPVVKGIIDDFDDVEESLTESSEVARVEYCVMDKLNNNIECFDNTDDAIAFAKENEGIRVLEVQYGPKDENGDEPELSAEEVWSIRESLEGDYLKQKDNQSLMSKVETSIKPRYDCCLHNGNIYCKSREDCEAIAAELGISSKWIDFDNHRIFAGKALDEDIEKQEESLDESNKKYALVVNGEWYSTYDSYEKADEARQRMQDACSDEDDAKAYYGECPSIEIKEINESLDESCSDKELVDKLVAFGTCDSEEEAEKRVANMSQEMKDEMCKSLHRQAQDHLLNDSLKEDKEYDEGPEHGYASVEDYKRSQEILDEMTALRKEEERQGNALLKAWAIDKTMSYEEFNEKNDKLHKETQEKVETLYKELHELTLKADEVRNAKNEAWGRDYKDYDPQDGWTEEDIKIHKDTDWRARNWDELDVGDEFKGKVYIYRWDADEVETKDATFHKFIRANAIYPPYYAPVDFKPNDLCGPMGDGRKHGSYSVHDRYEDQRTYNLLSSSLEKDTSKETINENRTSKKDIDRSINRSVKSLKESHSKKVVEESLEEKIEDGKPYYYIKFWEDEERRDQGESDIFMQEFETKEDAVKQARKLVDRDGFASVEVFYTPEGDVNESDDELVFGYDGVDTWGPEWKENESCNEAKKKMSYEAALAKLNSGDWDNERFNDAIMDGEVEMPKEESLEEDKTLSSKYGLEPYEDNWTEGLSNVWAFSRQQFVKKLEDIKKFIEDNPGYGVYKEKIENVDVIDSAQESDDGYVYYLGNISDEGIEIPDDLLVIAPNSLEIRLPIKDLEEGGPGSGDHRTASQRYNDRLHATFRRFDEMNNKMAQFLMDHGVSQDEVEELKKNTGLHGNALLQKLIDLDIKDEFFANLNKKEECKESKEYKAWSIKADPLKEEVTILLKNKDNVWEEFAQVENCPTKDMLEEDIVKTYSSLVHKALREHNCKILKEEDLYCIHLKVKDENGKVIKDEDLDVCGSKKEMEEKKKQLEEVSPEDSHHNRNFYSLKRK